MSSKFHFSPKPLINYLVIIGFQKCPCNKNWKKLICSKSMGEQTYFKNWIFSPCVHIWSVIICGYSKVASSALEAVWCTVGPRIPKAICSESRTKNHRVSRMLQTSNLVGPYPLLCTLYIIILVVGLAEEKVGLLCDPQIMSSVNWCISKPIIILEFAKPCYFFESTFANF